MGVYGYIRLITREEIWLIIIGLSSIIMCGIKILSLRKWDIKRIMVYSSIMHMEMVIVGLESKEVGKIGGIIVQWIHSIINIEN